MPWRALTSVVALCAVLAAVGVERAAHDALPAPSATAGLHTLGGASAVPWAARGEVSAALGAAQPAYAIGSSGGELRAVSRAQRLSASFDRSGVSLRSGSQALRLSLRSVGYGGLLTPVAAVAPTAHGNRVSYDRSGLQEWYVNGPLGVEQGFTLGRPASAASTQLTIALGTSYRGRIALSSDARSIAIGSGAGSLSYDGLTATDSAGRALPSRLALRGRDILLRVDTRDAHYPLRVDPLIHKGETLKSPDASTTGLFGISVAMSNDGSTALVGAPGDQMHAGAAWVFKQKGSVWSVQAEFTPPEQTGEGATECGEEETGEEGEACAFGRSVALSADGGTALVGAPREDSQQGAAWAYSRAEDGTWSGVGELSGGSEEGHDGHFGRSVALSGDGMTALVSAPADNGGRGAVWVFERSGSSFVQQGAKLSASVEKGEGYFGLGVALSADGDTALVGVPGDTGHTGAAWIFKRTGVSWDHGQALSGEQAEGGRFGYSVALSADGSTALVGARSDHESAGAAFVFVNNGTSYGQQGAKLTATEANGAGQFGYSVALSPSGNTALVGAPHDNVGDGSAWLFKRSASGWAQADGPLTGGEKGSKGWFGDAVALPSDGSFALVGARHFNIKMGAAFPFADGAAPPPAISRVTPKVGPPGGGTTVTISGTGFRGATSVTFGAVAASYTVSSSTSITAVSPAEPEGVVDVRVTTPAGTSAIADPEDHFKFVGSKEGGSKPSGGSVVSSAGAASPASGVLGATARGAGTACLVSLRSYRLAVKPHGVVALRLLRTGAEACRGRLALGYKVKAKGKRFKLKALGSAAFSIAPNASQVVRLRLSRSGRALLRAHHGKLRASLTVVRLSPAPSLARTAGVRLLTSSGPPKAATRR